MMNRRELIKAFGATAALPFLPAIGEATPINKVANSFTYCLNMATIRGHNLGFGFGFGYGVGFWVGFDLFDGLAFHCAIVSLASLSVVLVLREPFDAAVHRTQFLAPSRAE